MDDYKDVYRYLWKPGEDFHLREARTEDALESKDVLYFVQSAILSAEGELIEEHNEGFGHCWCHPYPKYGGKSDETSLKCKRQLIPHVGPFEGTLRCV